MTDDQELQALVTRARQLLQGVGADQLRTAGSVRTQVQQGMASIAADLDRMVVTTACRKLPLSDAE